MPRVAINAKKYAMNDFGKYLAYCRSLRGMTQSAMAEKMGTVQQKISGIENKPGRITMEELYEINKTLDLDMIQLLKAAGFSLPAIRDYFREYFKDHN